MIADNSVDVVYDCVGQRDTADRAMRTSLSTRLPCESSVVYGFYVRVRVQLIGHARNNM